MGNPDADPGFTDPDEEIRFYSARGAYGFLSNFFVAPMVFGGLRCRTAEHAFQCAKAATAEEAAWIARARTPTEAKRRGRRVRRPRYWEETRVDVMRAVLAMKFRDATLAMRLTATGSAWLVEASPRDRFWGEGADGTGENQLGRLLMALRDRFQGR